MITFISHLQVCEDALCSLYLDDNDSRYYLSLRLYEDDVDISYLIIPIDLKEVLDYIEERLSLREIVSSRSCYYLGTNQFNDTSNLTLLSISDGELLNLVYSSLSDYYVPSLSYRSIELKGYIKSHL